MKYISGERIPNAFSKCGANQMILFRNKCIDVENPDKELWEHAGIYLLKALSRF